MTTEARTAILSACQPNLNPLYCGVPVPTGPADTDQQRWEYAAGCLVDHPSAFTAACKSAFTSACGHNGDACADGSQPAPTPTAGVCDNDAECPVANGAGRCTSHTESDPPAGSCSIASCNDGFVLGEDKSACVPVLVGPPPVGTCDNDMECDVANGIGKCTSHSESDPPTGICSIATCDDGFVLSQDKATCVVLPSACAPPGQLIGGVCSCPAPNTLNGGVCTQPPPAGGGPINLRGAASFGLASREGLTSTGVTVVNGNVALHPLATCVDSTGNAGASQTCLVKTYSSATGMTVNGSIYFAGDPFDNGATAKSVADDLQTAWIEGKNKVDTQGPVAGNELSGKTFAAGVYHNAALGLAAGGTATMDAQNDANAVFIFKVDSSMTDSGTLLLPTRIKLVNGAQARNIYFVVGLDLTIGSGTTWNGTILAGRTATVNSGSMVNGRVLAGASGAGALTLTGAASPSKTIISVPH